MLILVFHIRIQNSLFDKVLESHIHKIIPLLLMMYLEGTYIIVLCCRLFTDKITIDNITIDNILIKDDFQISVYKEIHIEYQKVEKFSVK